MGHGVKQVLQRREVWWCLAFVVLAPLLARVVWPIVGPFGTAIGVGRIGLALSGGGGLTDIGGAVVSSHGLLSPDHTPFEPAVLLDVLNMGAYGVGAHTHPPSSIVLWSPLLAFDYPWWLSFWVAASAVAVAWSLRLMRVRPALAYPIAIGICLTGPGMESLVSTYPVSTLLLAAAWRFRDAPWPAGLALGLFTAERGVGVVLLLDPLRRRRWRTIIIALGVVAGLTLVAVAIEPGVIGAFLEQGRAAVAQNLSRAELYTPYALLERRGLPGALVIVPAVIVAVVAWRLRREPFWILAWVMAFITPLAWFYTSLLLLPLGVMVWRANALGRGIAIVTGFVVLGLFPLAPIAWNLGWTVGVLLLGAALLLTPVGQADRRALAGETPRRPVSTV